MKTTRLSVAALKKLKVSMSKSDDAQEDIKPPEESLTDNPDSVDTPEEELTTTLEEADAPDATALLAEVSDLTAKLADSESAGLKLTDKVAELESAAESFAEEKEASEKLVTNLSDNLRGVVNSMKVAMGHVELSDDVSGAALLKEYEFTLPKYIESIPSGSVTEEPSSAVKDESEYSSHADQVDYQNFPWSK